MLIVGFYAGYSEGLSDGAKAKVVNEKKVARMAYMGTKNSKGEE